jgi:hypothetical protein
VTTSYNGWPASTDPAAIGITHLDMPGRPNAFPPGVKGGDVATVLGYVALQLHKRVEPMGDGCWGYSYRKNRNANNLSCHASGTAIDYNAPKHPNGKHGTWTAAQAAEVRRILAECGGVVKWGEDFHGTVDGMHFEIHGTPAQVAAVAVRLRDTHAATPTKPASKPASRAAIAIPQETRMIVRFAGHPEVYEVVGSHLEHITAEAYHARGIIDTQVKSLPADHPLSKLPKQ